MLDNREMLSKELSNMGEDKVLFMDGDGFDEAIIGIGKQYGSELSVVYDEAKLVEALMEQGMDSEEAWDYYYVNSTLCRIPPIILEQWTPKVLRQWQGKHLHSSNDQDERIGNATEYTLRKVAPNSSSQSCTRRSTEDKESNTSEHLDTARYRGTTLVHSCWSNALENARHSARHERRQRTQQWKNTTTHHTSTQQHTTTYGHATT